MPWTEAGVGYRKTDTSRAAAPTDPTPYRVLVLAAVEAQSDTCDAISRRLKVSAFTVRPRLTELKKAGLIEDSGERQRLDSGKQGIVWRAVKKKGQLSLL